MNGEVELRRRVDRANWRSFIWLLFWLFFITCTGVGAWIAISKLEDAKQEAGKATKAAGEAKKAADEVKEAHDRLKDAVDNLEKRIVRIDRADITIKTGMTEDSNGIDVAPDHLVLFAPIFPSNFFADVTLELDPMDPNKRVFRARSAQKVVGEKKIVVPFMVFRPKPN